MTQCPECGQAAPEEAKFCERCGQGLLAPADAPGPGSLAPLRPGTRLKRGFEIVELINHTSKENRYLVRRLTDAGEERFQLRERLGPTGTEEEQVTEAPGRPGPEAQAGPEQDPSGPRAKTAELRMPKTGDTAVLSVKPPGQWATDAQLGTAGEGDGHSQGSGGQAISEVVPGDDARTAAASLHEESTKSAPSAQAVEPSGSPDGAAGATDALAQSSLALAGAEVSARGEDLGELFGRVLALSLTLDHPAFYRALDGFAEGGRVYIVYPDEKLTPLARRPGGIRMGESEALGVAVQVCQAIAFVHRRGLRLNDICPESVAYGPDGRIRMTGLDYVSNDLEVQAEPMFNDGYTAPEVYRGKKIDKRADIFSAGALLYACLTGERLEAETWVEEAGPVRFYPPHVVSPEVEQAVRRALVFDPAGRFATIDAFKAELTQLYSGFRVRAAVLTDVGMVREHNEDAVMAVEYVRDSLVEPAEWFLYVVADGLGGAEAGEVASAIAVATIRSRVETGLDGGAGADLSELLRTALEEANTRMIEYQAANPKARGMGSTAVAALIVGGRAAIAWVGDSRAYLLGAGALKQLTRDHSLVQRLVEIGQITAEQARHHEHKNVITRSLGARATGAAGAEARALKLKRGERLLLCSDGLVAHVADADIARILKRHDDPYGAARELVVATNAGGGSDNVSVAVVFAD